MQIKPEQALLVLNGLPKIGPITIKKLLEYFSHDSVAILNANKSELNKISGIGDAVVNSISNWSENFNLEKELSLFKNYDSEYISILSSDYPELLKEIYDPPTILYWRGKYKIKNPCIAIIGTRRPTLYGRGIARKTAEELSRLGFCIVSGMARGIDSEAHQGALDANGKTIAVLGNGLDIIYPPENLELYRNICKNGAVISEFPFGRKADRRTFPMRNRIVSGLCQAILVVETNSNGGSMITAKFAAEHNRQVFALPGRIDQASSKGCHQLIRDGAALFTSVDDILEELNFLQPNSNPSPNHDSLDKPNSDSDLSEKEKIIMHCFTDYPKCSQDKISTLTKLSLSDVASNLIMLELKHRISKRADGEFEKRF